MNSQIGEQILSTLAQMNVKLDRQDETLKNHGERLSKIEEIQLMQAETLKSNTERLANLEEIQLMQAEILKSNTERLANLEEIQHLQTETLKEQTSLISSLKNGQESLKAELSQLRLQNAHEFGEMKERLKGIEDSFDLLKKEVWMSKKDIKRIQKTMGMC